MRRRLPRLELDPEEVEREYTDRVLKSRVDVPGFRVAQHVEPLEHVGGDVLWHRNYDDGTTDVLLADAMGHGVEAGIHAAKLVTMLESLAAPYRTLQDILASLNRGMLRHRLEHESAFASGLFFRFRLGASVVRCANFGHTPPIFSGSGEVPLPTHLALGIVDTIPVWSETELDLAIHGTRFIAFSDGITEQFDPAGEMDGTERLERTFAASLDLELDAMVARIVQDLNAFRGDALVKDDRTLIAFELAS